jgi:hypothetical protein
MGDPVKRNVDEDVRVTDAEIEAIALQGEAGVNELIAAYEPIERSYFSAVHVDVPAVTSSGTTTTER